MFIEVAIIIIIIVVFCIRKINAIKIHWNLVYRLRGEVINFRGVDILCVSMSLCDSA